MNYTIKPKNNLNGTITVAGDKSISHRSIMLGAIAKGVTKVSGFLTGEDCLSTISCFRKMGIKIDVDGTNVTVYGNGIRGLSAPTEILDVGNSGTTMRLLTGLLSGQDFSANMTGDSSIQKRPMDRVSIPISQMGGEITGTVRDGKLYAPLTRHGKPLNSIEYTLPVASAQVKSAIILASLLTEGETVITEPEPTRDHTEIMLNYLGANIRKEGTKIICPPVKELYGKDITVPADISS
ncbi:MAG: 3-phosphoshikimate 1-carboxyvinyltransferase, partial [Anaerotignaceae bacterium]